MRFNLSHILFACVAVLVVGSFSDEAKATLVGGADDASHSDYDNGLQVGDNGGTGFLPWSVLNNGAGSGFGGAFINTSGTSIDTAGRAFGVYGNSGGQGQAIRPLASDLLVGQAFSLEMDNQGIDTSNSVGFSLQNSAGDSLFEFFFTGGNSTYSVNKLGGFAATSSGYTDGGLSLELTLTNSNSFEFTIDRLVDGVGVNVETVTGDLLANADQGIEQLRLFNGNGGQDVFFNSMTIAAVPEVSAAIALPLLLGSVWGIRSLKRRRYDASAQ